MKKNLFVNYYKDSDPERQKELETCLKKNLDCDSINTVNLVVDSDTPVAMSTANHEKVTLRPLPRRPTYVDFISLINLYGGEDELNIIANTDIYFDHSLDYLDEIDLKNKCLALSRWDVLANGDIHPYHHPDSQDCWMFYGKVKTYIDGHFNLGKLGCDNRISHEASVAGYEVINPAYLIKSYHLHNTGKRNYSRDNEGDLIPPPYKILPLGGVDQLFTGKRVLHIALNDFGRRQEGLKQALESLGEYREYDWVNAQNTIGIEAAKEQILDVAKKYNADFTFIQTQNKDIITPSMASQMPGYLMNWTGDVRYPVPSWYYDLGRVVDVTCFSNEDDMEALQEEGVKSDFLQIGYDHTLFSNAGDETECPDVVFMGNHYEDTFPMSRFRKNMAISLMAGYGANFGLFGRNWDIASIDLVSREAEESMYYRSCKIAINCSHFDYGRYSSDRIFRIMASGAFCLSHRYKNIEKDFEEGKHLVTWGSLEELHEKINYYLANPRERKKIAREGCRYVTHHQNWMSRVDDIKRITADQIDWEKDVELREKLRKHEGSMAEHIG